MAHIEATQVLFVEDELALAEIVGESLKSKGFGVSHATSIAEAQELYAQLPPQIIVLDVMLPDGSGFDFAARIRAQDQATPIIFLTSKSQVDDVVQGFEKGGNDYLKKPFSMAELIVRMKVLLSHNRLLGATVQQQAARTYPVGRFVLHYPIGMLENSGIKLQLTAREADLLYLLLSHKNGFISRQELLATCWGNTDYFSGRSLDVFISKLRRYLKADPSVVIVNVRGKGYKMVY